MRTAIVSFAADHLDAAGELLAARHAADRARVPLLPAAYAEPTAATAVIADIFSTAGARGVAAVAGGALTGFMLSTPALPAPTSMWALFVRPRAMRVPYGGYAAVADDAVETYRMLYGALAGHWVANGYFAHYADVCAADPATNEAWFSLGFGEDIAGVVRDTAPVPHRNERPALQFHRAAAEDIDVVMPLVYGLMRHHAAPPCYFPYLPETEPDQRRFQLEMLADAAKPNWLAYQDGRPVALQTFQPGSFLGEMIAPERSVYLMQGFTEPDARGGGVGSALLDHTLAWARDAGIAYCSLNFMTANLSGAHFWTSHGFRPVEYRLFRQVDERIAWAHGHTPTD